MRLALVLVLLAGCDGVLHLQDPTTPSHDAAGDAPKDGAAPPAGLIAWYKLDTVGTAALCAADATMLGHDGACTGNPAAVTGHIDSAFAFDGSTSVRIPHAADLDTTAGFTVAFWLQMHVLPSQPSPINCAANRIYGSLTDNSWQVCIEPSRLYFKAGPAYREPPIQLPIDSWHHLALAWDGSTMSGYYDGGVVTTAPTTVAFDVNPTVLGLDVDNGGASSPFVGLLDEVRIYNRALAAEEIHLLATM